MRGKIFYKLFAMSISLVVIVIGLQTLTQYFLLEPYYIQKKETRVQDHVDALIKELKVKDPSSYDINTVINTFAAENEITILLTDPYGSFTYGIEPSMDDSYLQVLTEDLETLTVNLLGFLDQENLYEVLKTGKSLSLAGYLEEDHFYPEYMIVDGVFYGNINYGETPVSDPSNDLRQFQATITDVNLYTNTYQGVSYINEVLVNEVFYSLDSAHTGEEIYIKYNENTQSNHMFYKQHVALPSYGDMYVFAVVSLQGVDESISILSTFMRYILIVGLVIATVIAYFFSKRISKPIMQMNLVAENMTSLNFDEKCLVVGKDEIGQLATNINSLSRRLEQALNDLTTSNTILQEDLELKDRMDQFRKRFIAHSSHELKTPLTVLKGISEGLETGLYDRQDPQNYKNILREVDGMSQLVHTLLEISALESSEVSLKQAPLHLSDTVMEVYDALKILIQKKNLSISFDLDDAFILADEGKIQGVIKNLINNALAYTPSGGAIHIDISVKETTLCFSIENTPARIAKDDMDKIWEPFYRGEKSRNKALGGTGLGLHLVKEILSKHAFEAFIENTSTGVRIGFIAPTLLEFEN